jgi:peptide/nickel transport system substrate-binding protein
MSLRSVAVLSILSACAGAAAAGAATRPRYGGTLRVEMREAIETADPPQSGPGMADLAGLFAVSRWEAGVTAVYTAEENPPGGRPFLDAVEIVMGRSLREQAADLDLGKADLVELGWNEARRSAASRRTWSTAPIRVIVLAFGQRVEEERVREALALAVNRAAIHNVLLQGQGEISGALLPQWLSGYAFLFDKTADLPRARSLVSAASPAARSFTLGVGDPALRPVADRIALNARDAGLSVSVVPAGAADASLTEVRVVSRDAAHSLAAMAASLGLSAPPRADSPEALYAAEKSLLEAYRVVPLFHLPDVYGVAPRLKAGPGISPLGEWRFENLWLEGGRP